MKRARCGTWQVLTFSMVAGVAWAGGLNDTGMTRCLADDGSYSSHCKGSGQDADNGRDATVRDDSDGRAGFSFLKLDANGLELPPDAAKWSCVRDLVTGLTWEIKTRDGGSRDYRWTYPRQDIGSYAGQVNAASLCGESDWRVPSLKELQSIAVYRGGGKALAIDNAWFPRTLRNPAVYWSSTQAIGVEGNWVVNFSDGGTTTGSIDAYPLRLVRGASTVLPLEPMGEEVADPNTGLIWRRCVEGFAWDGATCIGFLPEEFTLQPAIDRARLVSQSTGLSWRVPNVKELTSIVSFEHRNPAVDPAMFPNTPAYPFISSMAGSRSIPLGVWSTGFYAGESFVWPAYNSGALRLVRDGAARAVRADSAGELP